MEKELRVHHLFCIPMYRGKGYSDEFCRNMQEMISALKDSAAEVRLVCSPDIICSACPNLTAQNTCRDDSDRVTRKDDYLAEALKLNEAGARTFQEYEEWVGNHITEEIFYEACRTCRWLEAGLCSFDKLKAGLQDIK